MPGVAKTESINSPWAFPWKDELGHWPYAVFHLACLLLSAIWPFPPLPAMGNLGPHFIWCSFPFSKPTAVSLLGYSKLCQWKLLSGWQPLYYPALCPYPLIPAPWRSITTQLHFDLVLHCFVVWSLCSIRLSIFVLELRCDIKVITILVAKGRIGLDHERSVYCLAKLRPMHYFHMRGKGSCYRGEWTTLAESSEASGNSKYLISLAQIPPLNLRSHMLIRNLTMV